MVESKCLSCTCTTWSTHEVLFQPFIATCLVLMSVLFWNLNNTNGIWIPFNKHSSKWNVCVRSLCCFVKHWCWTFFALYLLGQNYSLIFSLVYGSLVASDNSQHNSTSSSTGNLCRCAGPWQAFVHIIIRQRYSIFNLYACIMDALLLVYAEPLEQSHAER